MKARQELHIDIKNTQSQVDDNEYLQLLLGVNQYLMDQEIPITDNLKNAITLNLQEIREGTGSLPTHHANEVRGLITDAVEQIKNGETTQALMSIGGAGANAAGFFAGGGILKGHHNTGKALQSANTDLTADAPRKGNCTII